MDFDVFICHASEDKDAFVRPLAENLVRQGVKVWFDEFTIRAGDSLRESIDRGLAKSRTCVVVLSRTFFEKAWPQWELNGIVQRHLSSQNRVLLPVWLDVTAEDVRRVSPPLADIFAVRGVGHIGEIAATIKRLIISPRTLETAAGDLADDAIALFVDAVNPKRRSDISAAITIRDGAQLVEVVAVGPDAEALGTSLRNAAPLVDKAVERRAMVTVVDHLVATVDGMAPFRPVSAMQRQIESVLVAPLFRLNGEPYGVVTITSTKKNAFTRSRIERITRVASVCGPLVELFMMPRQLR